MNKITTEELVEYFKNTVGTNICKSCGKAHMIVGVIDTNGIPSPVDAVMLLNNQKDQGMNFYLTYCPNCCYSEQYIARYVDKKIIDSRTKPQDKEV